MKTKNLLFVLFLSSLGLMSCDKSEQLTQSSPSKKYFFSEDEHQLFGDIAAEWNWRLNVDGIHFYNACKRAARISPKDGLNHIFWIGNNGPSHDEFGIDMAMDKFTEWFNVKFGCNKTSKDVADQLLTLRKSKKLPRIRK